MGEACAVGDAVGGCGDGECDGGVYSVEDAFVYLDGVQSEVSLCYGVGDCFPFGGDAGVGVISLGRDEVVGWEVNVYIGSGGYKSKSEEDARVHNYCEYRRIQLANNLVRFAYCRFGTATASLISLFSIPWLHQFIPRHALSELRNRRRMSPGLQRHLLSDRMREATRPFLTRIRSYNRLNRVFADEHRVLTHVIYHISTKNTPSLIMECFTYRKE